MAKKLLLPVCLMAGVAAFWFGTQASDEFAMAFVGVLCGIVASIPVSVLLLIALTRDRTVSNTFQPETETLDPNRALTYVSNDGWTVTHPEPKQINARNS